MIINLLLKIQLFTTFYMTGIIWLIQVIHYPLFKLVEAQNWQNYHKKHLQLTSIVIAGPMIIEILSLGLLFYLIPDYRSSTAMLLSAILLIIIWATTFFISVPTHNRLALKFDDGPWKFLVQTNWIRTISWTLKSFLILNFLNLT